MTLKLSDVKAWYELYSNVKYSLILKLPFKVLGAVINTKNPLKVRVRENGYLDD